MKRQMKGSFTIEASVIIPLFLWVFIISIQLLFYSHDRVVIGSVAHQTVIQGSGDKSQEIEDIETYFQQKIAGKTLLLRNVDVKVEENGDDLKITCIAQTGAMKAKVYRESTKTNPEKGIRAIRKLEKIQDNLGDKE